MSAKEFVKIAVGLREHPKILAAGDEAGWLFVCAIMWSKEHDTDGFIPTYALRRLTGLRQPEKVLEKCVDAGLFASAEGGWRIHDYLDHQVSSERRRAAGRKAATVRWERERAMRNAYESHTNRNAVSQCDRITEEEEEEEEDNTPVGSADRPGKSASTASSSRPGASARIFAAWVEATGKTHQTVLTDKRRKLIRRQLAVYDEADLIDAVRGWRHSPHHRGENDRHTVFNDLELLLRDAQHVEKFRDLERAQANGSNRQGSAAILEWSDRQQQRAAVTAT